MMFSPATPFCDSLGGQGFHLRREKKSAVLQAGKKNRDREWNIRPTWRRRIINGQSENNWWLREISIEYDLVQFRPRIRRRMRFIYLFYSDYRSLSFSLFVLSASPEYFRRGIRFRMVGGVA